MKKFKILDYATTLLLASIPVIVASQEAISQYVPVEYTLIFTIGMAALSQYATNVRVIKAKEQVQEAIEDVAEELESC